MESGEIARIRERLQGVGSELLNGQLGHERQLKGRVRRVQTFSVMIGEGSYLVY